jgi:hypothetical protein
MNSHMLFTGARIDIADKLFRDRVSSDDSCGGLSPLLIPAALTTCYRFSDTRDKDQGDEPDNRFSGLENGIFTFGMTIISSFPMMVEIGVLLDLLVGVFVMGIMIYHITKTFDNIDTSALSAVGD